MSGLTLTLEWIAAATAGGVVAGDPGREVGNVTTDSRGLAAGDFFIALRGERFDGHDFVSAAIEGGASGVLVDQGWFEQNAHALPVSQAGSAGVVVAADTLAGLQDIARALRRESAARVVAITGSAGKTTTKELIAGMLATSLTVVKNRGNLNNHIGLPLSLIALRSRPDVAVMELGMNHRGEISTLVAIADPDVRVWTNVGEAHLGFFASPDAIADAKAEVLEGADRSDLLVCSADDARIMARVGAFPGRTMTFGYSAAAAVKAVDVEERGTSGMRARLVTPVGERAVQTPLLGRGSLSNVLAAAAVALEFGIPLDVIASQAESAQPAAGRGAVRHAGNVTIIDDSYNSSPSALLQALEVLERESAARRKVAVLGEMLELGDHADAQHRTCGTRAGKSGLALLVTVGGPPAAALADAAVHAGMGADRVHHVTTSGQAAELAATLVQPGDVVLVKGSRGIRTDLVVDRLTGETA